MKYSFKDWDNKSGTVPVIWDAKHYIEDTQWYTHGQGGGFTTSYENLDVYSKNIGVLIPRAILPIFQQVTDCFDLQDAVCDLSKYTPGMILPWHHDDYPTYSRNMGIANKNRIVRIIVFLHDSQPGHQLWIRDRFCAGPAGSWFSWIGATRHMAANLGESDRYVIQITGHI